MSSQGQEDAILARLFDEIGTTNRIAVEIGARDGVRGSNTHALSRKGWTRLLFDAEPKGKGVIRAHVTVENINRLLQRAGVPPVFDLLSIDVDGNDWHLWRALTVAIPRVVVIEYNSKFSPEDSLVMPYRARHEWDLTDYYGASAAALVKLGRQKGYTFVALEPRVNLFFVRDSVVTDQLVERPLPPADPYGYPAARRQLWEAY
jgi:hypothetical protein